MTDFPTVKKKLGSHHVWNGYMGEQCENKVIAIVAITNKYSIDLVLRLWLVGWLVGWRRDI